MTGETTQQKASPKPKAEPSPNVATETGADSLALDVCPEGEWFDPHVLRERAPDLLKEHGWPHRPKYRCDRLVEHGYLERRWRCEDGESNWQYRLTNSNRTPTD